VSATLKLIREGVGMELRRGTFDVLVDGKSAVSIERHDAVEVPIDPGRHTIRIRAGRYSSQNHSFEASDDETITFRLHGAMMWPRYIASIVKPDLAIALRRD
jgi:hypothetical protein